MTIPVARKMFVVNDYPLIAFASDEPTPESATVPSWTQHQRTVGITSNVSIIDISRSRVSLFHRPWWLT